MPGFKSNSRIESPIREGNSGFGSDKNIADFSEISLSDIKEVQNELRNYPFENVTSYDEFRDENGGPYDDQRVDHDMDVMRVREREMKAAQQQEDRGKSRDEVADFRKTVELGRAFEGILLAQIQENELLGKNVKIIIPTRYDDVMNGVDAVIEVEDDARYSHLALGVDVASGRTSTHKKIEKVINEIRNGELAKMRYFQSKALGFRGQKDDIRRVIISADRDVAAENVDMWLHERKTGNNGDEYFQQRMRIQIFMELMLQLRSFALYAKRCEQTKIAQGYVSDFKFMKKTVAQAIKNDSLLQNNISQIQKDVRQDKAFCEMKELLERVTE